MFSVMILFGFISKNSAIRTVQTGLFSVISYQNSAYATSLPHILQNSPNARVWEKKKKRNQPRSKNTHYQLHIFSTVQLDKLKCRRTVVLTATFSVAWKQVMEETLVFGAETHSSPFAFTNYGHYHHKIYDGYLEFSASVELAETLNSFLSVHHRGHCGTVLKEEDKKKNDCACFYNRISLQSNQYCLM